MNPKPTIDPHPWHQKRLLEITPIRDAMWGISVAFTTVFVIWFGYELRAIFTPILIGLALAYLFDPVITQCERRWNLARPVIISSILGFISISLTLMAIWLGPKLLDQGHQLATAIPAYVDRLTHQARIQLDDDSRAALKEIADNPMSFLASKAGLLLGVTGQAVSFVSNLLGQAVFILATIALVPIYFFFFACEFGPMVRYMDQYLPASRKPRLIAILKRMDAIVATYFRARVAICFIMGILFSFGWAIVGVPYWLLLGMGSGLLSLIPFASAIGWPLAVVLQWLAMTTGNQAPGFEFWAVIVWPSVVYLVVQSIESWILTPMIQGKSLDMSAVTIMIVLFVGGAVGGLYGMLLGIPIAACIKIVLEEIVLPRIRLWAEQH